MKAISTSVHRGIGALVLFFHILTAGAQSGALDTSFDPGAGANIPILRSVVLPNGSYVIAGAFTSYDGNPCGRIARVLPGGAYDPTFVSGTGFNDQVNQIRVQSDGKIIAVGPFTEYNGTTVNRIVRLLPDGSLDGTFQPVNSNTLFTSMLEVLPDDRVLVSGSLSIPGVAGAVRLARFMPNGTLDQVLATMSNTNGLITSVLTIPDGRVMIGGAFTSVQGQTRNGIALLSSSGVLDTSFDPGSGFSTTSLTLQRLILGPSGGIYAVGSFTQYNGTNVNYLVRLLTSGAIDPTWNTSNVYNAPVSTVLELPGDKILLGGSFVQVNGISKPGVCALTLNGDLIPSFPRGSGSVGPVFQFHQLPSGNLLINGNFSSYNGVPRKNIARLIYCPVDEWYADNDNDGAGAISGPLITCSPPVGHVSNSTDCNDSDPLITSGTVWYADTDGDGSGDPNVQQTACSVPLGFVNNDDDCNDTDPLVTGPILWYMDQDGDSYGNVMAPAQLACTAPPGHVGNNTDCNDFDPTVHALSNWYADTDGDGFGDAGFLLVACSRPTGYVSNATDCDDDDPLATVVRDWYADADGDGFGNAAAPLASCAQPPGHVLDATDCNDSFPTITGPTTWYLDSDGDAFGLTAQTQVACTQPLGYSASGGDCNDADPLIFPNAPCDDGNAVTHFDRIRPDCSCAGQGVQVSPIVYLDVPLNAQGWMNATLLANGLLPTVEPYTAMGYTN
ncbi:MAG: delta-60 repeat domain-containing protein, partial [Flavobacteriales bacterium]